MHVLRYLISKTFAIQLVIAVFLLGALLFLGVKWLDYTTNHDQKIRVPNLKRRSFTAAQSALKDLELKAVVIDSAQYNPGYPKRSVVEQIPEAGQYVKKERKIYLTLNSSGYRKVAIPPLMDVTKRQAVAYLSSLGFDVIHFEYEPYIAKDVILKIKHMGEEIPEGTLLPQKSKLTLVLGDGSLNN